MRLRVQRLDAAATMPTHAHEGDAGYDLYALERGELAPGERAMVRTGVAVAVGQLAPLLAVERVDLVEDEQAGPVAGPDVLEHLVDGGHHPHPVLLVG